MTEDQFTAYHDGRYTKQLSFYDKRAISSQRGYRICSIWILIVSVAITPLISFNQGLCGWGNILAEILSPTIAVAAGFNAHFQFHENWLRYRATWDALQQELAYCRAGVGDYADENNRYALFVERTESVIAQEGSSWLRTHVRGDRATQPGGTA
jgi:hypothetical protein